MNAGNVLPKCTNGDYARPRLTGCVLSVEMKKRGKGNKGDLQHGFTGRAVLYAVLMPTTVGEAFIKRWCT